MGRRDHVECRVRWWYDAVRYQSVSQETYFLEVMTSIVLQRMDADKQEDR